MRITRLGISALALFAVIALAAGCGGSSDEAASMSKRVTELEGYQADCVKAGVQELAAQRTRVFRCTWEFADRTTSPCFAMVDGDLLDVTGRADGDFACSHVAALQNPPTP